MSFSAIRGLLAILTAVVLAGCMVERCEWTTDAASDDDAGAKADQTTVTQGESR